MTKKVKPTYQDRRLQDMVVDRLFMDEQSPRKKGSKTAVPATKGDQASASSP